MSVDARRGRVQGHELARPGAAGVEPRDLLVELLLESHLQTAILQELVEVDSGESIAIPQRFILNAAQPFDVFKVEAPQQFHSVKIDNPSDAWVELNFDGRPPSAAASDERIPPRKGRIITRPYDVASIGIDPAAVPAGNTSVLVTFYSRPLPPTTYDFATVGFTLASPQFVDVSDRTARLLGRVSTLGIADSLLAGGGVTSPGAGAAIAALAAPPAGVYDLELIWSSIGGAPLDDGNMELRAAGASLVLLAGSGATGTVAHFRRTLDGATALSVNAIAAGTVGARYAATIVATRVE